MVTVEFFYKQT